MEKFMLLDLFHALNGKLKVLYERRYLRDFHDVDWLLAEHTEEVRGFIEQLDEDGIRAFIDSLSAEKRAFWVDFFVMSDSENELNTNSRHAGDSSK